MARSTGATCGTRSASWRAAEDNYLLVPVGDYFTVKGEIKNVITTVAKTTHYWREHLPIDVKRADTPEAYRLAKTSGWAMGRPLGRLIDLGLLEGWHSRFACRTPAGERKMIGLEGEAVASL